MFDLIQVLKECVMPFKCLTCDQLGPSADKIECPNSYVGCNIAKVEVIHLLHPAGIGRIVGHRLVRHQSAESGTEEVTTKELALYLACHSSVAVPIATTRRSSVTCQHCLENIPVSESKLEE